ncbi:putative Phosphatidylinositol 3-kinase [Spironucleus salmonicida]|uniref:Phosphatidylinositol 3-kinase n=1 Tax=Spironucleus salmonicida TaxID=348837 RepID=V6LVU5_9EUKA|nr:putative Phosphatidylinositol 3-kinase [Spironucleus salmonicida]|eukprot:EST48685.1 Phosphatidylinositol 3-kinase, putative [Spironucleus salmonicida]
MDLVSLSSEIPYYALINFKQIKILNDQFTIFPKDYRISFQYEQETLETAPLFTDFNDQYQKGLVTFKEQQFAIPLKIQSFKPDDILKLSIIRQDDTLAQFQFKLFEKKNYIFQLKTGAHNLKTPTYTLTFEILAQATDIVFADKNYKKPLTQSTYLPPRAIHQLQLAEIQQIYDNNIQPKLLEKILLVQQQFHINQVLRFAKINANRPESILTSAVAPAKLQIVSNTPTFDLAGTSARNFVPPTADSEIRFHTNAEPTNHAIDAATAAFHTRDAQFSSTYNSLDYAYQFGGIFAQTTNFSRATATPSASVLEQLQRELRRPFFVPLQNAQLLLENSDFLAGDGASFAYVLLACIRARKEPNFSAFARYQNVPIEQVLWFFQAQFAAPAVREIAIHHLRNFAFGEVVLYQFQLTNCVQFDAESELALFLLELFDCEEKFMQAVQFPFYLQLWRDSAASVDVRNKYENLISLYFQKLEETSPVVFSDVQASVDFVKQLYNLGVTVKAANLDRPGQIQQLGKELRNKNRYPLLLKQKKAINFPFIRQNCRVIGINVEVYHVFKSNKMPLMIRLILEDGSECPVLLKYNDDVRNDVIVMQMFQFFDSTLQAGGIDLSASLYGCFAFSPDFGIIECVQPSIDIDEILLDKKLQNIKTYLKQFQTVQLTETQQTTNFIKSTALYSIMTFILAIGDRHSANIMVRPSGQLFHIDFGWLFNRDPKPYPPQMKISPEMIDTIGGVDSPNFSLFVSYLIMSYQQLRKQTNQIFTLLYLLVGSGIQVVEEDAKTNFEWLQNRLQLNLQNDQVNSTLIQIVSKQLNAVFPRVIDALHRFVQQQRK